MVDLLIRTTDQTAPPSEEPILHVRLKQGEVLEPGGSARVVYVRQKETDDWFIDSDLEFDLFDNYDRVKNSLSNPTVADGPFIGQNYGLPDEVFRARFNPASGKLECVGSQGLLRAGEAAESISASSEGTIKIYHAPSPSSGSCDGEDSTITVEACTTLALSMGDKVHVAYHPEFKKWRVISGAAGGKLEVGVLQENLAHGDVGTLELYKQEDEALPVPRSPIEAGAVLNITTITLHAGPLMYRQFVDGFDQAVVFPAQIEECLTPNAQTDPNPPT